MSSSHPLSHLTDAESALISSIDRAAEAVGNVGTSALDAALARLRAATISAADRLQRASEIVRELAGDVLVAAGAVAREIDEAITANSPPPPISRAEPTTPRAELTLGHVEHEAPDDGEVRADAATAGPSLFEEPSLEPAMRPSGIAQDRVGRDGAGEGPTPRPTHPDAAGERPAHPPGRNGKATRRR